MASALERVRDLCPLMGAAEAKLPYEGGGT